MLKYHYDSSSDMTMLESYDSNLNVTTFEA